MNQNRRARWTASALVAFALASPAFARHGGPPGRGPGGDRPFGPMFDPDAVVERLDERADRIAELLDLTDAQRAAFEQAREEALGAARPKVDRMRQVGDELRTRLDAGTTDALAVGAKVIEMHQLRTELEATRASVEAELVELLTDQQRFAFEALKEARQEREERGSHRFGHGPGRGPRHDHREPNAD